MQTEPKKYTMYTFLPLIIIFSLIIAFTFLKQFLMGDGNISSAMHDFMGAFFLVFGIFKLINLKNFAQAYMMYDLIAQRSKAYAYAYPFIEVTLGILYLVHYQSPVLNIVTLLLMLVSAAGVFRALWQGSQIECACLGTVFKLPMTYVTLSEDLVMAAMALFMLFL